MNIKGLLDLSSRVSIVMVLVMIILAAGTSASVRKAYDDFILASAIRTSIFERVIIRDEYYLYREARARAQLLEKAESFTALLERAKVAFSHKVDARSIEEMMRVNSDATAIYRDLFDNADRPAGTAKARLISDEYDKRLMSQLLIKAYIIDGIASELARNRFEHLDKRNRGMAMALIACFFIASAFVIINGFAIARFISKGIIVLLKGAKEIGGGNLEYRLSQDKDNELSEVAAEVNKMAGALALSFTSIENLEREADQRKAAEEEVRSLNASLEERVAVRTSQLDAANKELEAFAYSVSHDLKAPLRSIEGFSRIMLEDYDRILDNEGKRLLGIIQSSAAKLEELISDILSLSRAGRAEIKPSSINMGAMAQNAYDEIALKEEKERFEFIVDTLPNARGDPTLMRQVWINLISNALKYSGKSNTKRIVIQASPYESEHRYSVTDSGTGFNMAYASKLFNIFQRLHSSEEFEGTGVGLAIVKRIIERHGGHVGAEGELDKGAVFWFSIPVETTPGGDSHGSI